MRGRDQQAVRSPEVEHEHDQPARQQRDARGPESGARALYADLPNTEPTEATLSTPDAATIMKMANTCGRPQTTWLFIPVTTWPCSSMVWAAPSPASATSAPSESSAQNQRGAGLAEFGAGHGVQSPK